MSNTSLKSGVRPEGMAQLAERILEDIRGGAYQPGDRYLNGGEIARKHGVSLIMANRALQLLARRKVVERRRRAGTFLTGGHLASGGGGAYRCVHLIMPPSYFRLSRSNVEQALPGLHDVLPEAHLQYTFLPPAGEVDFVRQLVEREGRDGGRVGVVLYVSTAEMQQYFRQVGVPAVVFGSVYPEAEGLPWVDRDQRQIGEVLAGFLRAEGHRRVALLMRDHWGYGDNLLLDAIQRAFGEEARPVMVRVRSLPAVDEMAEGMMRALLKAEDAPTALICRSERLAQIAAQVAGERGIEIPRRLRLVVTETSADYPGVAAEISQAEQGAAIGRMLQQMAGGQRPEPDHLLVPVRLATTAAAAKSKKPSK